MHSITINPTAEPDGTSVYRLIDYITFHHITISAEYLDTIQSHVSLMINGNPLAVAPAATDVDFYYRIPIGSFGSGQAQITFKSYCLFPITVYYDTYTFPPRDIGIYESVPVKVDYDYCTADLFDDTAGNRQKLLFSEHSLVLRYSDTTIGGNRHRRPDSRMYTTTARRSLLNGSRKIYNILQSYPGGFLVYVDIPRDDVSSIDGDVELYSNGCKIASVTPAPRIDFTVKLPVSPYMQIELTSPRDIQLTYQIESIDDICVARHDIGIHRRMVATFDPKHGCPAVDLFRLPGSTIVQRLLMFDAGYVMKYSDAIIGSSVHTDYERRLAKNS